MGDGVVKKFAVILNADTEARHLINVSRAVNTLRSEGDFSITVLSPEKPTEPVEGYAAPSSQQLNKVIGGLGADDDDLLLFYSTGHGDKGASGEGCVELSDQCYSFKDLNAQLEKKKYGQRLMVFDNCLSGAALKLFSNPKTSIITQGSPGESVYCEQFAPYFWDAKAPDTNGDGVKSLQERFAYALRKGKASSHPQIYLGNQDISLAGKAVGKTAFPSEVKTVHNGKDLSAALQSLQPGQLALVTFSADWCGPCKAYAPQFDQMAKDFKGRFLMIRAEGVEGSEKDWDKYGIKAFPTVAFIDANGKIQKVSDRMQPLNSLLDASAVDMNELMVKLQIGLKSESRQTQMEALDTLKNLGTEAAPLIPDLITLLEDDSIPSRQLLVMTVLSEIAKPDNKDFIQYLLKSLKDPKRLNTSLPILAVFTSQSRDLFRKMLKLTESQDANERNAALILLAFPDLEMRGEREKLFRKIIKNPGDAEAKALAVIGLAGLNPKSENVLKEVIVLLQSTQDLNLKIRLVRSLTLFEEQENIVTPLLLSLMQNAAPEIRDAAYQTFPKAQVTPENFPIILKAFKASHQPSQLLDTDENSISRALLRQFYPSLDVLGKTAATWIKENFKNYWNKEFEIPDQNEGIDFNDLITSLALTHHEYFNQILASLNDADATPSYKRSVFSIVYTHSTPGLRFSPFALGLWIKQHPQIEPHLKAWAQDENISIQSRSIALLLLTYKQTERKSDFDFVINLIETRSFTNDEISHNVLRLIADEQPQLIFDRLESKNTSQFLKFHLVQTLQDMQSNALIRKKLLDYWDHGSTAQRRVAALSWAEWTPHEELYTRLAGALTEAKDHLELRRNVIFSLAKFATHSPQAKVALGLLEFSKDAWIATGATAALDMASDPGFSSVRMTISPFEEL